MYREENNMHQGKNKVFLILEGLNDNVTAEDIFMARTYSEAELYFHNWIHENDKIKSKLVQVAEIKNGKLIECEKVITYGYMAWKRPENDGIRHIKLKHMYYAKEQLYDTNKIEVLKQRKKLTSQNNIVLTVFGGQEIAQK